MPVIVRPGTFSSKTSSELYCLTGLLTLITHFCRNEQGHDLPMAMGTFTESKTEFVLAAPDGGGRYGKLRVPRAIAFQERK